MSGLQAVNGMRVLYKKAGLGELFSRFKLDLKPYSEVLKKLPARNMQGLPEPAAALKGVQQVAPRLVGNPTNFMDAIANSKYFQQRNPGIDIMATAKRLLSGRPRIGVLENITDAQRQALGSWYQLQKLKHDGYTTNIGRNAMSWWQNPFGRLVHAAGDDGYLVGFDADPYFNVTHFAPREGSNMAAFRIMKRLVQGGAPVSMMVPDDISSQLRRMGWINSGNFLAPHAGSLVKKNLMVNPAGEPFLKALYDAAGNAGLRVDGRLI